MPSNSELTEIGRDDEVVISYSELYMEDRRLPGLVSRLELTIEHRGRKFHVDRELQTAIDIETLEPVRILVEWECSLTGQIFVTQFGSWG